MNHCLFKAKDTKGAVGNTVDYSSLTFHVITILLFQQLFAFSYCHKVLSGKFQYVLYDDKKKLTTLQANPYKNFI